MTRTIAIIGAGGEIGSRLMYRLQSAGLQPRGILRRPNARLARRSGWDLRFTDGSDTGKLEAALSGCDVVIHAALDKSDASPASLIKANVNAVTAAWQAARTSGVKRFIFLSSIVALPPRLTQQALDDPHPSTQEKDWYSRAKVACELQLRSLRNGPEIVIVRPGIVYGPYMNWSRDTFSKLEKGVMLLPACEQGRCHAVHVDDLCDLLIRTCVSESVPPLLHGINPEPVSWADFYETHAAAIGLAAPRTRTEPYADVRAKAVYPVRGGLYRVASWLWGFPFWPAAIRRHPRLLKMATRYREGELPPVPVRDTALPDIIPYGFVELFMSTAQPGPETTGASVGHRYTKPLADGCREAASWWRSDPVITP